MPDALSSDQTSEVAAPVDFEQLAPPLALSPLDGRYRAAVAPLVNYLSEAALNRARIAIEVEWLIELGTGGAAAHRPILPGTPPLTAADIAYLRSIPTTFGAAEIAELAEIERKTVHDVKAVEYFIKRRLDPSQSPASPELAQVSELVHFGATSEDINNLAYALTIKGAIEDVWLPAAQALVEQLAEMADAYADLPMLAHTHGQPATPTTFGKEIAVYVHRLRRQLAKIAASEYLGKFNGATGTFGAHIAAAPQVNWPQVAAHFVTRLGLVTNPITTQIESHDWQSQLYDDIARFGRILHNLATDVWTYISMNYLAQEPVVGATGSSTMPHKVNPIRFENAEANLEIADALFKVLSSTLTNSRLQRDLTDSSMQRNIGVAFGHSLLAIDNLRRGLRAVHPNRAVLAADLAANWAVLAEPIQTAMRVAAVAGVPGMDNPYERLKDLTRGHQIDADAIREFIAGLGLPPEAAARLAELTPETYTGLAAQLVAEHV